MQKKLVVTVVPTNVTSRFQSEPINGCTNISERCSTTAMMAAAPSALLTGILVSEGPGTNPSSQRRKVEGMQSATSAK